MKMRPNNPNEDLQAIREIMERSSRFMSLSGLSGVLAGLAALAGVAAAWLLILKPAQVTWPVYMLNPGDWAATGIGMYLAIDAAAVLLIAILGAVLLSARKAHRAGQKIWTVSSRRLTGHLSIPLITGAVFALILISRYNLEHLPAVLLLFYGLALVSAGKFTLGEIHYLGITQIALGILAGFLPRYGLVVWATGFGLMHIVYGSVMYFRYK